MVQRKSLLREIEILKEDIPAEPANKRNVSIDQEQRWGWLSIISSLFLAMVGVWGFYIKSKTEKAKDEEIKNQVLDSENFSTTKEIAFEYESLVSEGIMLIPGVESKNPQLYGDTFELEFEYKGKSNFVDVKYLSKSKVGLKSIQRFISKVKDIEGRFWFIHNTDFTEMAKRKMEEVKRLETKERKFVFLKADNLNNFQGRFEYLLEEMEG